MVDTGTAFTLQGQIILLMLMEIGGLGQMTMTLLLIAMFSKRSVCASEIAGQGGRAGTGGIRQHRSLVKRIVLFALLPS